MAENKILDRITDAFQALRGEGDMSRYNTLGLADGEAKGAAMSFNNSSGYGSHGVALNENINRAVSLSLSRFAGSNVDWAEELGDMTRSSLVNAAVSWLATKLAECDLQVVEKDQEGKFTVILDHKLPQVWRNPNPYYDATGLWDGFAVSYITNGNPYFLKVRNGFKEPIQFWYVPPWMIWPQWPANDDTVFISHYEYWVNGRTEKYDPADVLHFRYRTNTANPRIATTPLESVVREIYGDEQWANYSALIARNCGIPPVIIGPADNAVGFTPEEGRALREEYQRRVTGDERGKAMIGNKGIKVERLSFTPSELDFKGNRRIFEERVASVLGIPAQVLGFGAGLDKNTYSNAQQAEEAAVERFLLPTLHKIEATLTRQLLPDFYAKRQAPPNHFVKFDTSNLRELQDDQDALYKRNTMAYLGGWLRRSEARASVGLPFDKADEVYFDKTSGRLVGQPVAAPPDKPEPEEEPDEAVDAEMVEDDTDQDRENDEKANRGVTVALPDRKQQPVGNVKADDESDRKAPTEAELDAMVEYFDQVAPDDVPDLLNPVVEGDGE